MSEKHSGFSITEMLVVAFIVLLSATLVLPAVRDTPDHALAAKCLFNLHILGVQSALLYEDRGGDFEDSGSSGFWPFSLQDYVTKETNLFCPIADEVKPPGFGNGPQFRGTTYYGWNFENAGSGFGEPSASSYGKNAWLDMTGAGWFGAEETWFWKNTQRVDRPDKVPLVVDGAWFHLLPLDTDTPQTTPDDMVITGFGQNMILFNLNRHNEAVNGVFVDGSARRIGLKELWTLKWLPPYNTENRYTKAGGARPGDWPTWMRHMEDY